MRNRTPLFFMELLVVILVFSLTAALCLQAFAWSDRMSEAEALKGKALQQAQNAAEVLKACRGDFAGAAESEGGKVQSDGQKEIWSLEGDGFLVEAALFDTEIEGLGGAEICAYSKEGELLFTLPVRWQTPLAEGSVIP